MHKVFYFDDEVIPSLIEVLYDTSEAAQLLGVPASAIRDWKTHERITPRRSIAGRGRGGVVPLYDLEDLRPLAEAYLARKASTRRP